MFIGFSSFEFKPSEDDSHGTLAIEPEARGAHASSFTVQSAKYELTAHPEIEYFSPLLAASRNAAIW